MDLDRVDITKIQIRYDDVDPLGHVNNARFLTYFEIGRLSYMKRYFNIRGAMDVNIVIARAELDFERSVMFDDDIFVRTWISRVGNTSFDFSYTIEDERGRLFCKGKTVNVFVENGRPTKAPEFLHSLVIKEGNETDRSS
ncbi:thioesterase family protein [Thermoplasma sp.]|uniref:acyl-CoA thioesterase n=1 Tax=Thermoplasma sp. TaxID=1973142 RepID=UPI00126A82E3|nr:thioesterase family protein [Thermoplasma sp.]KAA8921985.1 MAG: acyl-CoA thioesterase [Thermoplasma sp.]